VLKSLLGGAVLAAVKELKTFLKEVLIAGEHLGLLGLGG
jgi:hypothetical protein